MQHLLRKNDPVMASEGEEDGSPELNGEDTYFCYIDDITFNTSVGTFEGFSDDGESFSLRVSKDEVVVCGTDRFSISHDTALEYTKPNRGSPSISESG